MGFDGETSEPEEANQFEVGARPNCRNLLFIIGYGIIVLEVTHGVVLVDCGNRGGPGFVGRSLVVF